MKQISYYIDFFFLQKYNNYIKRSLERGSEIIMGNIVLLDELTINKIAAGEVIERPANVVKELVENSIDAGATNILIEIKNGGKSLIKISDNGKGISFDDIPLALERHATSKIRKVEDLEKTYTMGFRGEALASISSISKLTIISKTENSEVGIKVTSEAGKILLAEEIASKTGTIMIVENLFFNVPVRYKFLKNDATEFRYIKELVEKIALANTNISFKLINNNKNIFSSNGNGKIRDIIYNLYGKDIENNLEDVNYEEGNIKITGVVGNTLIARENRKDQIIFLNKRNIKNQTILNSADQAFKGGTGIGKFGFFILNIDMPATEYDVNVHPTKTEMRFKDEEKVYKSVYYAIKNATLNKDFLGNDENENGKTRENYVENEYKFLTSNFQKDKYFSKNNMISSMPSNISKPEEKDNLIERKEKRKIEYKYIGILFKTYIVAEVGEEIYLIDQHAAHERLLYEKIKENYKNNVSTNTQMMLIPEIYNLSHKEFEFVEKNLQLFKNVGYDIELFGENSVKINGMPDLDYRVARKEAFFDMLDEMLTSNRSTSKDIEERFIATVACKAAVKAGMDLKEKEVHDLIENLLILNNPYTCPHGRPTTIKLNKNELLEKS